MTETVSPFRASPRSPLEAHVFNLLCTRRQPWTVFLAGVPCLLEAQDSLDFVPACAFDVACGAAVWRVELGSLELLWLHPALADVSPTTSLPEELSFAVLELLVAPLLGQAQHLLGAPLAFQNPMSRVGAMQETAASSPCRLCFTLHVVLPEERQVAVPVRVCLPNHESAHALVERLDALPRTTNPAIMDGVPLALGLETGRMTLRLEELYALRPGDVLVPETYPAREGQLFLAFPCHASGRQKGFACSVHEGVVRLEAFVNRSLQETLMTQNPANPEELQSVQGEAPLVAPGELEVTLTFELERRLMSVRDVETLAPGYTFALGGDALSPVTLCVNGKAVGMGRLVDMNGTLGVQVTRVNTASSGMPSGADGHDRH